MSDLRAEFANPSARYRGAPFWSWNDRLQVEELVRQVHDMREHGMGGFFMHSREGLETEYMGLEWMECIRETVKAAKEAGTYAWLYDEDRWPSGAAGGLVPARGGDAFRAKALTVEVVEGDLTPDEDVLAIFRARLNGERLVKTVREPVDPTNALTTAEGEVLLVFRREVSAPSEWYNDDAPADNLNPDSVATFIEVTHEAYRREVGDEFGKTIPGIFTDEPNVSHSKIASGLPWVPWTDGLDEYFVAHRGYELFNLLPYLFFDGERSEKVRHDYWWTISERFAEAFSKQIGEWCESHGLAFTGHYLSENDLGSSVVLGGAIMPHYQYQQVPGIDMLRVQTDENLTVKQCTSVAHQFGREFVLSEMYGCSGWEMTFEDQKWVGDWQYVLGVSIRCQHLALYTLRGCRKRDYPPTFNYNTTWWKYNGVVEDYFARVGLLTTHGRAVRDLLVIHPVATAWTMIGHRASPGVQEARRYGEKLNSFTRAVFATHYDFDFGDEQIMASWARVKDGVLWVNQAPYKVVILPPGIQTLLKSTLKLLEQFLDAGGKVIAFTPLPTMVEGVEDNGPGQLLSRPGVTVLEDVCQLQDALEALLPRRVSICDERGQELGRFLYMQRVADDKHIFFVVNNDRNNAYHARLTLEGVGLLEEWDPLTGEVKSVPVEVSDGAVRFEADFGPAGSRLYVLHLGREPLVERPQPGKEVGRWYIGPVCRFRRTDPNVLTLDVCSYRMRDGEWSAPMPVWEAQKAIRESLGMRPVFYNGLPQRYKWVNNPHPKDGTPVSFRFEFVVRDVPTDPVFLLVEGAADWQIALNGQKVPNDVVGWYLDRSFHKVALPPLQEGVNVLTLSCAYKERMEVEDCYLLGDFGVNVRREIVHEPETLHFGDWCLQGYLHYAGSMVYLDTITYDPESGERILLTLGDVSATTVAVHVNGKIVGHIPWQAANGMDITPYLQAGDNEIGIEVVSSPRNMLGPLHQKAGYLSWTDWRSFRRQGEEYTPHYVLHPYGLFGQVHLVRQV